MVGTVRRSEARRQGHIYRDDLCALGISVASLHPDCAGLADHALSRRLGLADRILPVEHVSAAWLRGRDHGGSRSAAAKSIRLNDPDCAHPRDFPLWKYPEPAHPLASPAPT